MSARDWQWHCCSMFQQLHAEAFFLSLLALLAFPPLSLPFFFFFLNAFPSVFLSLCTPWLPKGYAKSLHRALNDAWKRNGNILALCVVLCNHCSAARHCFIHISAILSSDTSRKKPEPSNFKQKENNCNYFLISHKQSKEHRSIRQKCPSHL